MQSVTYSSSLSPSQGSAMGIISPRADQQLTKSGRLHSQRKGRDSASLPRVHMHRPNYSDVITGWQVSCGAIESTDELAASAIFFTRRDPVRYAGDPVITAVDACTDAYYGLRPGTNRVRRRHHRRHRQLRHHQPQNEDGQAWPGALGQRRWDRFEPRPRSTSTFRCDPARPVRT